MKSAFDVVEPAAFEWTDEKRKDLTDKIKTTCQQKFGHVFIIKIIDELEG